MTGRVEASGVREVIGLGYLGFGGFLVFLFSGLEFSGFWIEKDSSSLSAVWIRRERGV